MPPGIAYKGVASFLKFSFIPIDPRIHTLIPVMYRKCTVPDFIAYLYYLDYTRYKNDPKQVEEYFWDRLFKSVKHQSK